jgi:hypothetical protein
MYTDTHTEPRPEGSTTIEGLSEALAKRVTLDRGKEGGNGLAQLVLTLVKLIHELLEKQAIRRMEAGRLSEDELERLGRALMEQAAEIERLCAHFGLETEDLSLDLGGVHYIDEG